ncbi:MAG: HPr family phosphocarrier protein [Lachnospiraceae bacterium]|nr:HPr family phosphocarrier protein [Lachnospiraceae bacterium]MDY5741564.1 HPr family phosphocarrier protein [Lachnospiraceae bacterium]
MVSKKVILRNLTGLHLRPAGLLCNEAVKYAAAITCKKGESSFNAKSVLSVLGACIRRDDEIEIVADGVDEEEALAAIVTLIESGLGE